MKLKPDKYNDRSIMEDVTKTYSSTLTHNILNGCRLFLKVVFLSEIRDYIEIILDEDLMTNRQDHRRLSKHKFPIQQKPT